MTDAHDSGSSMGSKPHDPNALGWSLLIVISLIAAVVLGVKEAVRRLKGLVSS